MKASLLRPLRSRCRSGRSRAAAGRVLPAAAWTLADEALADRVVVTWEPGLLDVDRGGRAGRGAPARPAQAGRGHREQRHVEVAVDGVTAGQQRPAGAALRDPPAHALLPPGRGRRLDLLEPTDNGSYCPYKGRTDGYWTWPGPPVLPNVAWTYSSPAPAVGAVAGQVAFYNELVDITVDGVRQPRPESPFSRASSEPRRRRLIRREVPRISGDRAGGQCGTVSLRTSLKACRGAARSASAARKDAPAQTAHTVR